MFYADMYNYWVQFRIQPEILHKMSKYGILIDFSILPFKDGDEDEGWITIEDDKSE